MSGKVLKFQVKETTLRKELETLKKEYELLRKALKFLANEIDYLNNEVGFRADTKERLLKFLKNSR